MMKLEIMYILQAHMWGYISADPDCHIKKQNRKLMHQKSAKSSKLK